MIESVERRFGVVDKLPKPIEWLSDNGSPYSAGETRALARDIGLSACTAPIQSPQSNGETEALVKTIKRDYARVSAKPDGPACCASTILGSSVTIPWIRTRRRVTACHTGEDDRERGRRWAS